MKTEKRAKGGDLTLTAQKRWPSSEFDIKRGR